MRQPVTWTKKAYKRAVSRAFAVGRRTTRKELRRLAAEQWPGLYITTEHRMGDGRVMRFTWPPNCERRRAERIERYRKRRERAHRRAAPEMPFGKKLLLRARRDLRKLAASPVVDGPAGRWKASTYQALQPPDAPPAKTEDRQSRVVREAMEACGYQEHSGIPHWR